MQRERLLNDFSSALNNFQEAQRNAAEKEKKSVARARAHSGFSPVCIDMSELGIHVDVEETNTRLALQCIVMY